MLRQPLKNKVNCFDGRPHIDGKCFPDCDAYFAVNEVKSAVEWLKGELHKNTDAKSRTSLFQVSDIIKLIDEAFPDLCPSGDLIADKQNPQDKDKQELKKLVHEFALRA